MLTQYANWRWCLFVNVPLAVLAAAAALEAVKKSRSPVKAANIADEDSGVASAMLNTSQQIGGSPGTALPNTLFASAVTNYLISHHGQSSSTQSAAAIHGYHVAFAVGLIGLATVLAGLRVRIGSTLSTTSTPTDIDSTVNRQKEVSNP